MKSPVIIIGMHRSGTSLVAKLLNKLGLFIGFNKDEHREAFFFLDKNEAILNGLGGSWEFPQVIEKLLKNKTVREQIVVQLKHDASSFKKSLMFLGPENALKFRNIMNCEIPWGWKDPRTTVTLPLWLEVFPNAKILHVYRNGIDVVESLHKREITRLNDYQIDKNFNLYISRFFRNIKKHGLIQTFIYYKRILINRLNPLYKYFELRVDQSIERVDAFRVWETYMEYAFQHTQNINNPVMHIRYEDLLLKPVESMSTIADFADLNCSKDTILKHTQTIASDRAFAFLKNEELMKFYDSFKESKWFVQLGYNDLNAI